MPSPLHVFFAICYNLCQVKEKTPQIAGLFWLSNNGDGEISKKDISYVKVYYLLQAKRIQVLFRSEMSRTVLMTADIPKYSVMRLLIST